MSKELIILGMGASRRLCPFDRRDIPIWSCNTGYTQIAEMNGYVTKIFMSHEQHTKQIGEKDGKPVYGNAYNLGVMNNLAKHGVQILNIHRIKKLKMSLYPLKRIDRKFKANGFFSNTISYMLAYAIDKSTKVVNGRIILHDKGFEKIKIYGVDMLTKDEYELEKGGIEYWIGYARGLGIEVEPCEGTALCKTCTGKPYGIKFFDPKDFDPWEMLKLAEKEQTWIDQAMPTKKQLKAMQKSLRRTIV